MAHNELHYTTLFLLNSFHDNLQFENVLFLQNSRVLYILFAGYSANQSTEYSLINIYATILVRLFDLVNPPVLFLYTSMRKPNLAGYIWPIS